MTAVVVLRHFAMPLALNDDIWAKYRIGALLNVTDPTTKVAAVRNVFRENVPLHPGLTYKELAADPRVVLTACNKALTVISMMAGQQIGVAPDVAKREFTQGLLPGFSLVASGVYAVHRAQQAGCTYCKA
jgi:intracellular sulfur oxidation DsrE/DsrF family protein